MVSNEELRSGAAEWLLTIEEGARRLQEVVNILCSSHGDQLGVARGTVTLQPWLEDMMQSMLEVIWELEEGPAPSLDDFVDWHQAGLLMHRCYDIFRSGQDRYAALEAGWSSAITNGESRGNNNFCINIDCNDCNDNDIIDRGGGGNNSDDNVDNNSDRNINNNNNNNNNNNKLTIVNYSFLGVMNDNCGDDIVSKAIDVGGGENINENGDNNDNNNFNIFNNNNNNNKQLKNINHNFIAIDNYGDEIEGKGIDDNNCGDEIDGQRIDDNNGAIGIGDTDGNNNTDRWQRMSVG
ncbi:hypothetical protein CBR_g21856 [Chara braunii]|uniref:Uncharacterized protein n=1 Tax=Chara braunii TaxID=69332 RepID=A0A388JUN3_CHABU|nr:hypothetical protein CBR_g21856 [Chara braunii]|eukprot:GBG61514.1 hypothetical protein CBR_g21856 [Chara braunii]